MSHRNGNVELLRFIFASTIVLHHAILPVFYGGWLGVEFFFILSGFYMAKEIYPHKKDTSSESISMTIYFSNKNLKKRFCSLLPYMLISTIIGFIVQLVARDNYNLLSLVARLPYEFFFLQNYGFAALSCTGTVWYLSAMFLAIWLLYPIVRRHYDMYVGYAAPVLTLLISGYLVMTYGMLGSACEWLPNGLNSGFLRAVSEITWGMFLFRISNGLKRGKFSKVMLGFITSVECICYMLVLAYMFLWKMDYGQLDPICVLLMSIGVVITTSEQSLLFGKFDNKVSIVLGKFSMVLFMNHAYWLFHIVEIAEKYGLYASNTKLKILGIVLSYITSMLVMLLGNLTEKMFKMISSKVYSSFDE